MTESTLIQKARSLILSVKDKKLSLTERKDQAIQLAAAMLEEAQHIQTKEEKRIQHQLSGMMNDPMGKVFTTVITDQCFRSHRAPRAADQLVFLIKKYGIPKYFTWDKRWAMKFFTYAGKVFSQLLIPIIKSLIRKETSNVILPGEDKSLKKYMAKRHSEGVRVNLNHLGEAILGEEEAQNRLQIYLTDLKKPDVEYISIKISTIFSQINLLAWDDSLNAIADRLRLLYRAAQEYTYQSPNGTKVPKFVNLDMEEYRDLHLTIAVFRKVLDEPEFLRHSAGIVLQSYLPDSFLLQQELTIWAMQRLARGGAPIKIRIVKGANLAMEQFEAALHLWPQAPYTNKADVDANYKRMVSYGCQTNHAKAAHIGIASHNLFDIAYGMLLRAENNVEKEVSFEMLEGMADHMRRVVQLLAGDMLLYCPAANEEEFQNAVAYLVRRLDENTAPENFLRQAFDLKTGSDAWAAQAEFFSQACLHSAQVLHMPRRTQNRFYETFPELKLGQFENEPDTDWSLPHNCLWAKQILLEWKNKEQPAIPLVIGGSHYPPQAGYVGIGEDPARPNSVLYQYAQATQEQLNEALNCAKKAEQNWSQTSIQQRAELLHKIAQGFRKHRKDLIGAMVADTGKTVVEADVEISEAIDFANYYAVNLQEWSRLTDIQWRSKGTILVAPPWNFPCSIPSGGILAALVTGNCVLFKPPPESVLVGWELVKIFWEAGVSQNVLQFINCKDEPEGSLLIQDPRVSAVVLTGATSTAKLFMRLRPDLDLMAETGGKNTMVITALSDRDLAIKDLVHSAFGHAGQKCSACSLAILEAEVYDDPHFLRNLKDAAASWHVGTQWDLKTRVNPLIRAPGEALLRGLTQLEEGEEWLLKPVQDKNNPNLWSPGIKLGVKPANFTFQTELFGPVLGLVRAATFDEALQLMNQTPYGLTAGIHTLDTREQKLWLNQIEAGNCYINRTITGAIVERQPFGGCKDSSFGKGAKAGGPNYLTQFMHAEQHHLPEHRAPPSPDVQTFMKLIKEKNVISQTEQDFWTAGLESDAFYWKHYFSRKHDPSLVRGQDNFQSYVPHRSLTLIVQKDDTLVNILREIAAALCCGTPLEVISDNPQLIENLLSIGLPSKITVKHLSSDEQIEYIKAGKVQRLRILQPASEFLQKACAQQACHINLGPALANGRLELLNFLREVSISRDYHRYGNLGDRENEKRAPLPLSVKEDQPPCSKCDCHAK
jgi:RHH-type proline utilization regulon transcriptional repressor/proline dehydrogenase/delta 1-pyrroline-5-carboxylate dehydrogenase